MLNLELKWIRHLVRNSREGKAFPPKDYFANLL